jgi:hypothetical protein
MAAGGSHTNTLDTFRRLSSRLSLTLSVSVCVISNLLDSCQEINPKSKVKQKKLNFLNVKSVQTDRRTKMKIDLAKHYEK